MQFFWEKKAKSKGRSRFNLLLLEYGEYYFEDFSVYIYPVPLDGNGNTQRPFSQCDALKVQGRLKLCSRSLIFEPSDLRRPLIKFPLKMITSPVEKFRLKPTEEKQCSVEVSGFFTFTCSSYFEMKANDKVGPFRQIDWNSPALASEFFADQDSPSPGAIRVVFAIVHSDLAQTLAKIQNLKKILEITDKEGRGVGFSMLNPLVESASTTSFDSSQLVNFHERLLFQVPISVKKVMICCCDIPSTLSYPC